MPQNIDTIAGVIGPVLEGLGLELYDIEITGHGRNCTVRVMIDRPKGKTDGQDEGGVIDLAVITAATEAVSPLLDGDPRATAALTGPYTLEVSSPGLERPLRTPAHFQRAIGSTVSIKARPQPASEAAAFRRRGTIMAADDAGISVNFDDIPDGTTERIAYDDITQARTVFEWGANSPTKPSSKSAKKSSQSSRRQKQEAARS